MSENISTVLDSFEKILEANKSGEELAKSLKEAQMLLVQAVEKAESPEEHMSLNIALQELNSLQTILAEKGKRRELTLEEQARVKESVKSMQEQVKSLDVLFDLYDFSKKFEDYYEEHEKRLHWLDESIGEDSLAEDFEGKASAALDSYASIKSDYSSFSVKIYLQFPEGLPDEIAETLQEMETRIAELEERVDEIKREIEFAKMEKEFLQERSQLEKLSNQERLIGFLRIWQGKFGEVSGLGSSVETIQDYHFDEITLVLALNGEGNFTDLVYEDDRDELEDEIMAIKETRADKTMTDDEFKEDMEEVINEVSKIVNAPDESSQNFLPKELNFYDVLLGLLDQYNELDLPVEAKASGLFLASNLFILKAKVLRATSYYQGLEIWEYKYLDPEQYGTINDEGIPFQEYFKKFNIGEVSHQNRTETEFSYRTGVVAQVDIVNESVLLEDGTILSFRELENGQYYKVHGQYKNVEQISPFDSSALLPQATECMKEAERLLILDRLKKCQEKATIIPDNIPSLGLLRHYLGQEEIEIKEGKVILTSKGQQVENEELRNIVLAIEVQVEIEESLLTEAIYRKQLARKDALEKNPYLNAHILFTESQRYLHYGESFPYKARAKLVEFLKEVDEVKKKKIPLTPEIEDARETAILQLVKMSQKILERLKEVAFNVFSRKEEKVFLDGLLEAINKESQRVEEERDYKIKPGNLKVDVHWLPPSLRSPSYREKGRPELKKADIPIGDHQEEVQQGHTELVLDYEAYEAGQPKEADLQLWNTLVGKEAFIDYEKEGDVAYRRKKFEEIGQLLSGYPLLTYSDRRGLSTTISRDHSAAQLYYREAISGPIDEIKFEQIKRRETIKTLFEEKREKYKRQAVDQIKASTDSDEFSRALKAELDKYDIQNPELIEKIRKALKEQAVDDLADELLKAAANKEFDDTVMELLFAKADLGKLDVAEKMIAEKIDELDFAKTMDEVVLPFVTEIAIIVASMVTGNYLAMGVRFMQLFSFVRKSKTLYGIIEYLAETLGFTIANESLSVAFLDKELTPEIFAEDLGMNLLMFGAAKGGSAAWARTGQRLLLGTKVEGQLVKPTWLYSKASRASVLGRTRAVRALGSAGERALRLANFTGELGTEAAIFTAVGVPYKLATTSMSWEDIDGWEEYEQNVITLLALKGANAITSPTFNPITAKAQRIIDRTVESINPRVFESNFGLKEDSLKETKEVKDYLRDNQKPGKEAPSEVKQAYELGLKEAELSAIRRIRIFMDRFNLSNSVFKGKTLEEIDQTIKRVSRIFSLESRGRVANPSSEALMSLAQEDLTAFEIVTSKLPKVNLEVTDLQNLLELYKAKGKDLFAKPRSLVKLFGKIPSLKSALTDGNFNELADKILDRNGRGEGLDPAERTRIKVQLVKALKMARKGAVILLMLVTGCTDSLPFLPDLPGPAWVDALEYLALWSLAPSIVKQVLGWSWRGIGRALKWGAGKSKYVAEKVKDGRGLPAEETAGHLEAREVDPSGKETWVAEPLKALFDGGRAKKEGATDGLTIEKVLKDTWGFKDFEEVRAFIMDTDTGLWDAFEESCDAWIKLSEDLRFSTQELALKRLTRRIRVNFLKLRRRFIREKGADKIEELKKKLHGGDPLNPTPDSVMGKLKAKKDGGLKAKEAELKAKEAELRAAEAQLRASSTAAESRGASDPARLATEIRKRTEEISRIDRETKPEATLQREIAELKALKTGPRNKQKLLVDEVNKKYEAADAELKALKQKIIGLERRVSDLNIPGAGETDAIGDTVRAARMVELDKAKRELKSAKEDDLPLLQTKFDGLERKLGEERDKLADLDEPFDTIGIDTTSTDIAAQIRTKLEKAERDLMDRQRLPELRGERDELQALLPEYQTRAATVDQLKQERDSLKTEVEALRSGDGKDAFKGEIAKLEAEKKALEGKLRFLDEEQAWKDYEREAREEIRDAGTDKMSILGASYERASEKLIDALIAEANVEGNLSVKEINSLKRKYKRAIKAIREGKYIKVQLLPRMRKIRMLKAKIEDIESKIKVLEKTTPRDDLNINFLKEELKRAKKRLNFTRALQYGTTAILALAAIGAYTGYRIHAQHVEEDQQEEQQHQEAGPKGFEDQSKTIEGAGKDTQRALRGKMLR